MSSEVATWLATLRQLCGIPGPAARLPRDGSVAAVDHALATDGGALAGFSSVMGSPGRRRWTGYGSMYSLPVGHAWDRTCPARSSMVNRLLKAGHVTLLQCVAAESQPDLGAPPCPPLTRRDDGYVYWLRQQQRRQRCWIRRPPRPRIPLPALVRPSAHEHARPCFAPKALPATGTEGLGPSGPKGVMGRRDADRPRPSGALHPASGYVPEAFHPAETRALPSARLVPLPSWPWQWAPALDHGGAGQRAGV